MTDRPIIFSPTMVRALLAGRKTQTRRLATSPLARCVPGDRLWVREGYAQHAAGFDYRADFAGFSQPAAGPWRPSIHMPRWASRLTLHVEAVRVERLQDIREADAVAEGMNWPVWRLFQSVWNSLHGPDAWNENPHVVVLTFRVERANIDAAAPAGAA